MPKSGAWGAGPPACLPTTAVDLSFHVNLHFKSSYISRRNPAFWARNPVGGREAGRPLYNDTAPVIPPKERNHPIFRLTFHLTFYHREIRSPHQSVAQFFASESQKLCKKSWMTLFAPGPGLHLTGHAMVGQGRAGSSGPQLAPPRGRSPPVGQSSASRPKPKHKNPVCTA